MTLNKSTGVSTLLLSTLIPALLVGCGGSGDSDDVISNTTAVSLRFSDAPVTDAAKVVITVDSITFVRNGSDILVDSFTSDELGIEDEDTFTIDLLEVQGNDNLLVLDSVDLPPGNYTDLRIGVIDDDANFSYVEEISSGLVKAIKVPSDELKLGGFTVRDADTQGFVIEFDLRQSMTYNPHPNVSQQRYILKPRGVRIVDVQQAASVAGTVNLNALHAISPCTTKLDQTADNVAYVYAGHDLNANNLGDVFVRSDSSEVPEFDPDVPADAIAPVATAGIDGSDGSYLVSYLTPGDYTLAISCMAENDDPVIFDDIAIPAPATQLVEITLGTGQDLQCGFPLADGVCN